MGHESGLFEVIEFEIQLLFVVCMMGYLFYILINSKRSRLLLCYSVVHALTLVMVVMTYLSRITDAPRVRTGLITVSFLLKLLFDIMFVLYSRQFFNSFQKKLLWGLVFAYACTGFVVSVTNPLHHMFLRNTADGEGILGSLYYVMMMVGFLFETTGMLMIQKYWVRRLDNQKFRTAAAMLALFNMALLHLYMTDLITWLINPVPLVIWASFSMYFIGAYKYGMFGAISLNSMHGLGMFTDALTIVDDRGKIIYKNLICEQMSAEVLQQILINFLSTEKTVDEKKEKKSEMQVVLDDSVLHFTVTRKLVRRRFFSAHQYLYIIHDNTKLVAAINLLSERNQYLREMNDSIKTLSQDEHRLAVLRERNILAKELHDIVGHSLILALNTMESNKLLQDDKATAIRRIRQAVAELDSSFAEAVTNPSTMPSTYNAEVEHGLTLIEKLSRLAKRLAETGITLDIDICEDITECQKKLRSNIYRICQESITNAMKHGHADQITVSIKRKDGKVELYVVDNGKGCASILKGTGLTNMEERVAELHGRITFDAFEDHTGFMVRATIPEIE